MTKATGKNAENTTDNGVNGRSRFEPIKEILIRCDEKTVAYSPTMSALAA